MIKVFRAVLAIAILALAACSLTVPTGDFNIAVTTKTSADPLFGKGVDVTYTVNGAQGAPITLKRGTTYTFGVNSPGHPFYISTNADGGPGFPGEITAGVTNSRTEFGVLSYTPDNATTSPVYYNCGVHLDMGGMIILQ